MTSFKMKVLEFTKGRDLLSLITESNRTIRLNIFPMTKNSGLYAWLQVIFVGLKKAVNRKDEGHVSRKTVNADIMRDCKCKWKIYLK